VCYQQFQAQSVFVELQTSDRVEVDLSTVRAAANPRVTVARCSVLFVRRLVAREADCSAAARLVLYREPDLHVEHSVAAEWL
jgi:hypothetical protein